MRLFIRLQILMILFLTPFLMLSAATPSWQNFVVYVDGVKTQSEAEAISSAIAAADPEKVKAVEGLTPQSGHIFIDHDHHNTRLNTLVQAARSVGTQFSFYVKMEIPDYQKIQGTLLGDRLQKILDETTNGIECVLKDKKAGLFHVVFHGKSLGDKKRGFNMGDLAHPISDPVIFNGLGLNMNYLGVDGKGGMVKNAIAKEMQFFKSGKKPKPYPPELMIAYQQLFQYPTPELETFYKSHPDLPQPKVLVQ
ncbi:MAG: hypothetical protein O3C43_08950 [Verrucomicrobia bacterium]|nr:hypothetical protein [Verrucomicrobiota bacterium]MDA1066616.1 hypothetical protein [Verrucomicrobiota bacterium]